MPRTVLATDNAEARQRQEEFIREVEARLRARSGLQTATVAVQAPRQPDSDPLSVREREVASLLLDGLTDAEIAAELWIAPVTVKSHMKKILVKMNAKNRTHAAVMIVREILPTTDRPGSLADIT